MKLCLPRRLPNSRQLARGTHLLISSPRNSVLTSGRLQLTARNPNFLQSHSGLYSSASKTSQTMATRRSARLSAQPDIKLPPPAVKPPPNQSRKRKTPAAAPSSDPVTPPRKRASKTAAAPVTPVLPPPMTPTPSAVGIIAERVNGTAKPRSRAVNRLADPKTTNAPVISPETSRVLASDPIEAPSPTKAANAPATGKRTTTANILEEACRHLIEVDPRMKPLIEKNYCRVFSQEGLAEKIDPFESLCSGIISQQVSGAAARSIKNKFIALFSDEDNGEAEKPKKKFPQPSEVAPTSIERLRTAGLSQRKAEYVKGLAEKFASGELTATMLAEAPYEEVRDKLIAVRGLGLWSVEMFACFGLKRMDVFSLGDLGVQRGMAAFVGRDVAKLKAKGGKWKYMSEKEMAEMASPFAPYRSVFMWYMWRVEETDISTLE